MAREHALDPDTLARLSAFWHAWAERSPPDAVSLVTIADDRYVQAPEWLRSQLDGVPCTVDALAETLGDTLVEIVGEARLAFADTTTIAAPPTEGVTIV